MKSAIPFCFSLIVATAGAEPWFQPADPSLGLEGLGGGKAAWIDFDNDGWVDLHDGGTLWRNHGGTNFVRVKEASISGPGVWGDYDQDGFVDVYAYGSGKLYRNLGGKGFEDQSALLSPRPMDVSRGAAWGDFDGNGFPDLFVGGYEIWQKAVYQDAIYRNLGPEGFQAVVFPPGKPMSARGISTADYDEDGDLDVYVSNYRLFPNILWNNDGRGQFADRSTETGTAGNGGLGAWGHTIGSAWGDLDNDGHLDLFVGNFSHPPAYQDRPQFLRNRGKDQDWTFEDKSGSAGLHWQESYASPTLGDFDQDGDLDLFFTTVYAGDHSVLYRNEGAWTFTNVTRDSGIGTATTYQAAWADFDRDGDLDLVSGGKLFVNRGNPNHWLEVRLQPRAGSNAPTPGAQVRIKLTDRTLTRQVETGTGEGNQNDPTLHFGIGAHEGPVELEIVWPDQTRQTWKTPVDRLVEISKPASLNKSP